MRVFITGVGGFAGRFLAEECLRQGATVAGLVHHPVDNTVAPEQHRGKAVRHFTGDILDFEGIKSILLDFEPEFVFHLAGIAHTRLDVVQSRQAFDVNVSGTMHVLEACCALPTLPRVLFTGSSQVYGGYDQEQPLSEDLPYLPISEYGVTKAAAELLCRKFWLRNGLPVVMTRSFNHTGPGQALGFVASDFSCQIARIALGMQEPVIETGSLEVYRDFTDVRDVARAYLALARHGEPGESYNVCSGISLKLTEMLNTLIEVSGLDVEQRTLGDMKKKAGNLHHVGDSGKLHAATGWKPEVSMRQTLSDLFEYWKTRLSQKN